MSLRFDFAELSATDRYKLLGGLVMPRPIALGTSHGRTVGSTRRRSASSTCSPRSRRS